MVKKPVKELKNIHFCIIMIKNLIGIAAASQDLKRSSENSKKRSVLGMYVRHVIGFFSHLLRKNAATVTKV